MRTGWIIVLAIALAPSAAFGAESVEKGEAAPDWLVGRWERLAAPGDGSADVHKIGVEPGGVLWVTANNRMYYWDGEAFREPQNVVLRSGMYLGGLYGGADRGLYASQPGEEPNHGKLFKLSDGEAQYVTDFYYEVSHQYPGLYVSRSGRLFNWGHRFVAAHVDGEWRRIEAPLSLQWTTVLDMGDVVCFAFETTLCAVDKDGTITQHELQEMPTDGHSSRHLALWGDDMLLIVESPYGQGESVFQAYKLPSCRAVDVTAIGKAIGNRNVRDAFRAGDGAVWLYVEKADTRPTKYAFVVLTPEGDLFELDETEGVSWAHNRSLRTPSPILNASDGALWLGLEHGDLLAFRDGRFKRFGWRDGLGGVCWRLVGGAEGVIYARVGGNVYRFRPGERATEPPPWVALWDEYRLASGTPIRDSEGNIWACLADHPGAMSRWDGTSWRHVEVPFDTAYADTLMADDRGHILVQMRYPERTGCDVSVDGVVEYDTLEDAVVGAVEAGVRHFERDCVVLDDGRILLMPRHGHLELFDGSRWHSLKASRGRIAGLCQSVEHGVVIRTNQDVYYTLDAGKLVELPAGGVSQFMWGSGGLQPFEEAVYRRRPSEFAVIEKTADRRAQIAVPRFTNGETIEWTEGDVTVGPHYTTLTPGLHGGHWTDYGAGTPRRLFGLRAFRCDLADSPLRGLGHDVRQVFEDKRHNVWIDAGWRPDGRCLFVKRLSAFRLERPELPTKTSHVLQIKVKALLGGESPADARLFYRLNRGGRLDGGPWLGGDVGPKLTIEFPEDGTYQVEVIGMGPLGGTTPESLTFTVTSKK